MSSRSTSPTPSSKAGGDGGSSDSGGVTSLSTDALYKPLQANSNTDHPSSKNNDDRQSKKKDRHSLSLQTAATLRESSLVSFLATMGNNIKTSHPQECHVYRRLGGSICRYGTGDSGRADKAMRNNIESKLSNRSLVLVGGGIHTHTNTSSAATSSDVGKLGGAVASKRIRKRVGGTGVFGCKSHRVRKKAMRKIIKTQSSEIGANLSTDEFDKEVGNIVETLHQMWLKYIEQILSPLQKNTAHKEVSTNISLELRKDIATKVSTSEHIGMSATIVACPSRRHLVQHRCIVINETKEIYKIAILKSCPIQVKTKKRYGEMDEVPKDTTTFRWKVVLLPKHKTALDVSIPWSTSSTSDLIVVRLET